MKKVILFAIFTTIFAVSSLAQSNIRKVNFQNFTYHPYCAGEDTEKITVKNGEFSKETKYDEFIEHFYFNIFSVTYGDLNGDKKDEAVILSVCNTGGTGNFSEGFIYTMKAGKPTLLARIPGGDRAIGGLVSAKVENGLLTVVQNDPDRNQASCCSEFELTTKLRLNGKKLDVVGKPISYEIYPAQRVSFPKGASKTTIKIDLDDIKRFKIGARAGQTLVVTFTSDISPNVFVTLPKGDADVTEINNGISAKLNQNGDYVIQVQNTYKFAWEVTLTIEIR